MAIQGVSGGVPLMDFGTLGELGATYKDARMQANRQQSLAALGQGASVNDVAKSLLQAGDVEGGMTLARLGEAQQARSDAAKRDERDFGFRQTEATRQQGNADRQYGLQYQASQEKPTYQKVTNPATGNEELVKIDPLGKGASKVEIAGMETQPASPYGSTHKLTGEEAKDRLFVNRLVSSHNTIVGLENINDGPGGYAGGVAANQPLIRDNPLFNAMSSADRQRSIQAQRDFVNAILRKESGAAISSSEFENAQKQYFPQPGDKPENIAQKRNNRMQAIEGMMQGTGKGYAPPAEYVGTKGPAVPSAMFGPPASAAPNAAPAQPSPAPASQRGPAAADALAQARAAIAKGADKNAVAERLKQNGIDPAGL